MDLDLYAQRVASRKVNDFGSLLSNLPDKERQEKYELLQRLGDIAPTNDGFFTEMGKGFKLGLLQAGRGIGTSVEELGGSSGMADYFNDKLAYNRHLEPASDYSALSLNPGNIGRTIGGAGASTLTIAPAMAAGTALGGPVGGAALGGAVVFAQSYGDNILEYRDRLAPMGKSEDEIRMLALGRTLVDSGIEVGLGATPVAGKMLSGFVSGIAQKTGGQVTKELARGALDGLAERTVNHLVQKYGHETLIRASKELLEGTGGEMLEEIGNTANGYLWRAIAGDTQDAPDLHDYAEAAAGGFWGGLPFGGAAALGTVRRLGRARREAQSADVEASARNEWEEAAAAQEARENAAAQGTAALQDVAASREAGVIMPEMAGAPAMDAEETVAPDMAQEIVSRQVIHPESVEMPDGSVQVTFPEEAVARAAGEAEYASEEIAPGGKVPPPGARANALRGRVEGTEAPEIDGLEMADLSDAAERNPIEAAPVSPNGAEAPSDAVKQERQPFTIEAINANLRFRRDRIAAEQLGETLGGVRLEVIDPRKSVSADPAERSGMALLQRLGRVFNTRPVLVRGEGATGFDGNYFDGRLFLDLDARPPLEQATITLNHEITHRLAADNPEAFRNFADSLETLVENPELYRDRLNRYRDAIEQYETQNPDGNYRIDKSPAALREEFVADFLGEEMAKPTFWRKLAERDLTFARKILSILEDVYRKFTGSFKGENRSEADRIFGSNLERAVDVAREYVAESREAETPSRDWTGALKRQPENAAAEATQSFDDWKNGFFRRIDETAHPEDPTVARLKAETEARRDYWDDPGKRGRLAARAEELLETVQRNREAIERKKAAPGGKVPPPGAHANAPAGGVRGKESEAKTPGLPGEGTDGADNIYLRMPLERVRKDAANGVKLAQEALRVREARETAKTPAEEHGLLRTDTEAPEIAAPGSDGPEAQSGDRLKSGAELTPAEREQALRAPHSKVGAEPDGGAAPGKSAAEKEGAPKSRSGVIEDFGEKIEGARKDYAQKLSDASRNDPAAVPLSQAFPEPDYDRLAESGIPARAVSVIHALRDSIGAKPRNGWRLAQYTKQLQTIREIARQIVNRELDSKQLDKVLANPLFNRIRESAELYEKLGHSKSLKGYRLSLGNYSVFGGVEYKPPKLIWTVSDSTGGRYRDVAFGDTREEAVANFKKYLDRETGEDRTRIKFGIFQYRPGAGAGKAGKVFIGKKVGSNTIELKRFDTAAEAREYLGSHQQELEELLKLKQYVPATRSDVNRGRIGQDYRGGKDVTPEMFQEKFGFRGVQFGNWVGKTEERQQNLNEAYDALHDLAGLLNVSTQALSLNGELGLAFGARGKGGVDPASAHYEPGQVVINLTRRNGAGSLAHEWFHALDNYFSRKGGVPTGYLSSGKRGDFAGVRPEMVQAFRKVIAELHDKTGIFDRSERLDEVRSKPYWSTDIEVAARAFESYLHDRIEAAGGSSDYLVNLVGESAFTTDMLKAIGGKTDLQDVYPYPAQKESAAVKKIFDEFVGTLREKSESGRAVLFSLPEKLLPPGTVRKEKLTRAEVEKLVAEKKNYLAPDDKPVRNVTVSTDRHLKTSEAEAMLKGIAANPMLRITSNMDTGIVGIITSETARKSRSGKAVQASSVPAYVHAAAMANLKTLFRNAALGVIQQGRYENDADTLDGLCRFYAGMRYEDQQYGVKITAKAYKNGKNTLYSVEAHDIEVLPETAEKKPLRENGEGEKGYLFSTDPQSHALAENGKGGEHLPAKGIALTKQFNAFSEKIKSQTEKKPLQSPGEARIANFPENSQPVAPADISEGGGRQTSSKGDLPPNTLQFSAFFEKFKPHDEIIGEKYRDNPKAQHGEIKLSVSQKEADEPGMQTGTKTATGPLTLKGGEALHDQVNPIRKKGEIHDRHQRKLETEPYKIRSKAELNRDAAQRIADNGGMKGVIDQILAKDITFESDVAHRVGTLVLNSKEFKRLDTGSQTAIADAWIKAGMEAARALGARRLAALNLDDIESIQAHVNALVAKIARKKPLGDLKKTIKAKLGIDLFDLPPELAKDPRKLDGFLRELVSENASGWDKMYEFWINSILSGIGTHTANTIGNTANAVYELGMKRFAEASLNLLFRKDDAASFGEFPVVAKAIFNSGALADAITRAKLAWDREILTADGKIEACRAAISGRKGRIIRIPGRALRFADEFSKALIAPAEAAAFAYREAKAQKLNEAETRRHIGQALADPGSAARQYGEQRAMELTFQENPGRAVNALIRISEDGGCAGWIVKYALPFKKTPYNILRQGVRKSPLGALNLMYETGKAALGKRKIDNGFIQHAAEQLLAWGAFLSLCGMADDDDETPFLTGSSPDYGSAEQKFKIDKIPPYSIRLGGTYFSYKRIEPLASMLAVMADGVQALREAKKSGDWDRAYDRMLRCVKQVVSEKTFLSSLGELNKLMEEPERNFGRAATNFAASWMPNIVRQTVNSFDDTVRDHKSRSRGMEWWKDQFDITVSSAGIVRAAPKIDYFGREITKEEFLGAAPLDAMFRLVLPVNPVNPDKNMDDAERLIWNYNRKMPDKPYYPDVPDYYFRRNGKTLYFTGEDYQQFARESGQMAHKRILGAIRSGRLRVENPGTPDIILIRKFYQDCRKLVRDRMYRQKRYSE